MIRHALFALTVLTASAVFSTGAVAQAAGSGAGGGASSGQQRGLAVPAYVLVEFPGGVDAAKVKSLLTKLTSQVNLFGGKPVTLDFDPVDMQGTAPGAISVIMFENAYSVSTWKLSQDYKDFVAAAEPMGNVRIVEMASLITPAELQKNAQSAQEQQDAKETLKSQQKTEKKMEEICKGC